MNVNEMVEKLYEAKERYYDGESILSDAEFDALEDKLRLLDPENIYFSVVGTSIKGSKKIKHAIPMLSCSKAKSVPEVKEWLRKIKQESRELVVMPKIDGMSATLKYSNGELSYISTRGDGLVGQDVSHLAQYLDIPRNAFMNEDNVEIRGEIYLPKNTKFPTEGKPLRNIAVGLVNRKTDRQDCSYLKFTAYYKSGTSSVFSEDLEDVKGQGFHIVDYSKLKATDLDEYFKSYLGEKRNYWLYETDGLVVAIDNKDLYDSIDSQYTIGHHHMYNIALKPPSEGLETVLRGIEWDVSKQGNIIPVANFDPIFIGGREIKKATLNNAENVIKNNLHYGDVVRIELANDVIPYFVKVVSKNSNATKADSFLIDTCPSCGHSLISNGVHFQCDNNKCSEKNKKMITAYCQACEMDGISYSTISTLYDNKFIRSVEDLYVLSSRKRDMLNLEGFGDSKVTNLLEQIEKSKNQTIVQFVARLGIDSVGEKAVTNLGIKTKELFMNFNNCSSVNGNSIVKFRNANKDMILRMIETINPQDEIEKDSIGKICMTGSGPKGRKELTALLEEKGYEFVDGIQKDTCLLICEDPNGTSSKLQKARKLGIKIVSYEEFFK